MGLTNNLGRLSDALTADGSLNVGVGASPNASYKFDVTGAGRYTGALTITAANSTTTGGGQLYLNGATGNRIDFNTNGVAAPAFTTRSAGTKILLYPAIGASSADYAIGIEGSTLWSSVDTTSSQFKWYAGTTNVLTLTGAGAMTLSRNQNAQTNLNVSNTTSGVNSQVSIGAISDASAGSASFGKYSTASTAYKIITAKNAFIYNSTIGGDIAILNDFATGTIKFAAGGSSTAQLTIAANGNITQSVNQNGVTGIEISNTNNTSLAYVRTKYTVNTGTNSVAEIFKLDSNSSAPYAGLTQPSDFSIINWGAGSLVLENRIPSGVIKFAAGNSGTAQVIIKSTGQLQLNNYTSSSSFTGTSVAGLGVDASGNVITTSASSSLSTLDVHLAAQIFNRTL